MARTDRGRSGSTPASLDATLAAASDAFGRGDPARAETLCRQVLSRSPRHAQTLHLLGLVLHQTGRSGEAIETLRRAVKQASRDAVLLNNFGNVLKEQGLLAEASTAYRRALDLRPDYHNARFNLGKSLQASGDAPGAVACFEKLLAVAPTDAGVWDALGASLLDAGRAQQALDAHHKAVELAPDMPDAHNDLGLALVDLGRFEEAADCYRRALVLKPDFSKAALNLSKVRRFGEADGDDLALIRSLAVQRDLSDRERADVHFALGKIHDDLGDHDTAFQEYRTANELRARGERYDATAHAAWISSVIETFSVEFLARFEGRGSSDSTPIFIVGMPRSGTSLVEQILASHTQVHGAGELSAIENLVAELPARLKGAPYPGCVSRMDPRGLRWFAERYLASLRVHDASAARITDKMPGNFLHLGLIAIALPAASIVHCRRDPMDVGLSLYFHQFAGGHAYSWRLADIGRYVRQYRRLMMHWHRVLPGRVLDLQYEELVTEPERVARCMVEHCGLAWEAQCLRFHDTQRAVHTASSWQVRQPIYRASAQRWRKYERFLGELGEALADDED